MKQTARSLAGCKTCTETKKEKKRKNNSRTLHLISLFLCKLSILNFEGHCLPITSNSLKAPIYQQLLEGTYLPAIPQRHLFTSTSLKEPIYKRLIKGTYYQHLIKGTYLPAIPQRHLFTSTSLEAPIYQRFLNGTYFPAPPWRHPFTGGSLTAQQMPRTHLTGEYTPRNNVGRPVRLEGGQIAAIVPELALGEVQHQRAQACPVRVTVVDQAGGELVRGGALLPLQVGGGQHALVRHVVQDHGQEVRVRGQFLSGALHLRDVAVSLERSGEHPCPRQIGTKNTDKIGSKQTQG